MGSQVCRQGTPSHSSALPLCPAPQPTAVLELPTEQDILQPSDVQLPNAQYSSDHLALLVEFHIRRGEQTAGSPGASTV